MVKIYKANLYKKILNNYNWISQYWNCITWFVPHNPEALIFEMGKERFVSHLNDAMEQSAVTTFNALGDDFSSFPINHGNEPAMEVYISQ